MLYKIRKTIVPVSSLKQKHRVKYNQKAHEEEILAAGDVCPQSKQVTQPSNAGALTS